MGKRGLSRRQFIALAGAGAAMLIAASIPARGFDAATPPGQRSAMLFSWDGVQREHLMKCLSSGQLPNLAALIKEGRIVNIDVTGHETQTKPGHVQMLTGYDPDVTGTESNGKFRAIPEGLSVFERLESAFGDEAITTVMFTGGLHHVGACPPSTPEQRREARASLEKYGKTATASQKEEWTATVNRPNGEPFYNVRRNVDFWHGEARRPADVNGPYMLKYIEKCGGGRFFMFCHFMDPDHAGHAHGENSREYTDAIVACDKWLGRAIQKLKELGVYDRTMVFVTSDHGFDEGQKAHKNAPRVTLATNTKALAKDGNQRDIVPTILTEMGVDISKLEPRYKGVALTAPY